MFKTIIKELIKMNKFININLRSKIQRTWFGSCVAERNQEIMILITNNKRNLLHIGLVVSQFKIRLRKMLKNFTKESIKMNKFKNPTKLDSRHHGLHALHAAKKEIDRLNIKMQMLIIMQLIKTRKNSLLMREIENLNKMRLNKDKRGLGIYAAKRNNKHKYNMNNHLHQINPSIHML